MENYAEKQHFNNIITKMKKKLLKININGDFYMLCLRDWCRLFSKKIKEKIINKIIKNLKKNVLWLIEKKIYLIIIDYYKKNIKNEITWKKRKFFLGKENVPYSSFLKR